VNLRSNQAVPIIEKLTVIVLVSARSNSNLIKMQKREERKEEKMHVCAAWSETDGSGSGERVRRHVQYRWRQGQLDRKNIVLTI
jgi:hypothetical protein